MDLFPGDPICKGPAEKPRPGIHAHPVGFVHGHQHLLLCNNAGKLWVDACSAEVVLAESDDATGLFAIVAATVRSERWRSQISEIEVSDLRNPQHLSNRPLRLVEMEENHTSL